MEEKKQQISQITKCLAIGLTQPGPVDNLQIVDLTLPQMNSKDLLVLVKAVSINPVDIKNRNSGRWENNQISNQNPLVLGYDCVGEIVAKGPDAHLFEIGNEVYYAGNIQRKGTNSQYHVVDERIVGRRPKDHSKDYVEQNKLKFPFQSAGVPLVALTAWEAILENMKISEDKAQNKGKVILITGGGGGVGSMAIQIAKKICGLKVIATSSRPETQQFAKQMGADEIIDHKKPLKEQIQKLQQIDGVDYILHTSDMKKEIFDQFTFVLNPMGHICGITGFEENLNMFPLFVKRGNVSLELMFTRPIFNIEPEKQNQILDKVAQYIEKGILETCVKKYEPFNLENLKEAHKVLESGQMIGKYVLYDVDKYFNSLDLEKNVVKY